MFSRTRIDELILRIRPSKAAPSVLFDASQRREQGVRNRTFFGRTANFTGDITLDEDLQVDGTIRGSIRIRGRRLGIGKRARVTADVHANTIEVQGKVEGDIHGQELVHLSSTAIVDGNIYTQRIVIEDGARLNGQVEMRRPEPKASESRPALTRIDQPRVTRIDKAAAAGD